MASDQWFNLAEAFFWMVFGAAVFVKGLKESRFRRCRLGVGVTLFIFGLSDLVEIHSRTWWSPRWLLALKAACLASLLVHLLLMLWVKLKEKRSHC